MIIGTNQVKGSSQDRSIRDGAWLTAVQEELESLHALSDGTQIHYVLVLHSLLVRSQALWESMASYDGKTPRHV